MLAILAVLSVILAIGAFAGKHMAASLDEQEAETYAAWRKAYPQVEVSRDEWKRLWIHGLLPKMGVWMDAKSPILPLQPPRGALGGPESTIGAQNGGLE